MTSQVEHTDVGAYALGLLEEDDRRAFEDHLRGCGSCAAELHEMTGTAHALAGIKDFTDAVEDPRAGTPRAPVPGPLGGPAAPGPGGQEDEPPGQVIELMRQRRRAARRARRGTYVIGAAAATVLLAAGVTIGSAIGGSETPEPGHGRHGPAQALVIWGERHSASDGVTGASGVVGLESKGWGTHVGLELRGVRGPLRCRLEAVSTTGQRSVVTGWAVPPKGYGVPGSQAPLITHGGTAIPRDRIDRFEVVIEGTGDRLLTIPL
ncbi:anti-sigma factor family protein [Actinomadura sp. SCN-SB]|uniref:anti-sigma factor family protein n=1 Tax=Actinomadura sp. SCN-SB TaxID=3373092 RepID=UPI0037531207